MVFHFAQAKQKWKFYRDQGRLTFFAPRHQTPPEGSLSLFLKFALCRSRVYSQMLACLQARREVSNLNAEDLGFSGGVDVSHISLYDHLTPRLQELLFESKKFKDAKSYKYCWAKNGFVYLRKTDTSTAVKLCRLEDLQGVASQSWAKSTLVYMIRLLETSYNEAA